MRPLRISLSFLIVTAVAVAQPTANALARIFNIEYQDRTGTAFSIDVDGREYWVTATHILTGAKGKPYGRVKEKTLEIKLLNPGGIGREWLPMKFTVLQPDADVDIAVLVPENLILANLTLASPPGTSDGMMLGGPCEFLGYPLDGGWRAKIGGSNVWMPYVKHCTVSGGNMDIRMWILDGINNPGFSGGPVILGTGNDLKFAAVISGYYLETAEVISGRVAKIEESKSMAYVNSGFIIAYDIAYVIDVIKKNPTGPMRPAGPAK